MLQCSSTHQRICPLVLVTNKYPSRMLLRLPPGSIDALPIPTLEELEGARPTNSSVASWYRVAGCTSTVSQTSSSVATGEGRHSRQCTIAGSSSSQGSIGRRGRHTSVDVFHRLLKRRFILFRLWSVDVVKDYAFKAIQSCTQIVIYINVSDALSRC